MDISVGDRVQIVDGGLDVTNGLRAKAGEKFGDGGPFWAEVVLIDPIWNTRGKFGLPDTIKKVRCAVNGVIVWQVQPEDCCNVIKASDPRLKVSSNSGNNNASFMSYDSKTNLNPSPDAYEVSTDISSTERKSSSPNYTLTEYAISQYSERWDGGVSSTQNTTGELPDISGPYTNITEDNPFGDIPKSVNDHSNGTWRDLTDAERKSIGSPNVKVDESAIIGKQFETIVENEKKKRFLLNDNQADIQNGENFPILTNSSSGLLTAKYSYQIIPGDKRLPYTSKLEDELTTARASLGIPIHGNNQIAKSMKYFMYNRFKVPDPNLVHNKSITHVFFTRPDLNLLQRSGNGFVPNAQCMNHTESAMLWRRNPEIFKLLTAAKRCGDSNDFNLLLSNQVTSFDIQDENISTNDIGKSWNEYTMPYGDAYTGRTAGDFTCNFDETSDYSIISLMKLWITYIDNVARGAWKPSYNLYTGQSSGFSVAGLEASHVYTKTLDYAASAYVFKCGPDGEDVLYWSKYYGVFPTNTGANTLSWDISSSPGNTPKPSIKFKYAFKKDLSPISLIEFNNIAKISNPVTSENSFNSNYNHSSRPYVGAPYIELNLKSSGLVNNDVNRSQERTSIRLKFLKDAGNTLTDDLIYRYSI